MVYLHDAPKTNNYRAKKDLKGQNIRGWSAEYIKISLDKKRRYLANQDKLIGSYGDNNLQKSSD